ARGDQEVIEQPAQLEVDDEVAGVVRADRARGLGAPARDRARPRAARPGARGSAAGGSTRAPVGAGCGRGGAAAGSLSCGTSAGGGGGGAGGRGPRRQITSAAARITTKSTPTRRPP